MKTKLATFSGPSKKWNTLFDYFGLIFNLIWVYQYLSLWIAPDIADIDKVLSLSALIVFEFVMVHSGVFMAVMPAKISLFVFFPFYGLFALGFNLMVSDNSIIIIYLVTIFNRMRFAFFNVDKEMQGQLIVKSVLSVSVYFFLLIAVALLGDFIPEFGLSSHFLESASYETVKSGAGGLMIDSPNVSMCMGTLYYLLLTFIDFKLIKKHNI